MSQPNVNGRLAGKVCGITGATGIAEAAAERFAAEGARLFVVALREEDCVALAGTDRTRRRLHVGGR